MLILFTNFSSAVTACTEDQRILRLSSTTNAHGEVYNGVNNYPVEICYDAIFGKRYTEANPHACSTGNANKVLRLSASTNAHGEIPSLTTLGYQYVCYGDLVCRSTTVSTDNCNQDERLVVALLTESNSHINAYDSPVLPYTKKICCKSAGAPVSCNNNGIKDGTEQCDGNDLGGATCPAGTTGTPTCSSCTLSTSSCTSITTGAKSITEVKWTAPGGTQALLKASKQSKVNLFGKTTGYATSDRFSVDVYKNNNQRAEATNVYTLSPDTSGNVRSPEVTLGDINGVGGTVAGDKVSFDLISRQDANQKRSNELEIIKCDPSQEDCSTKSIETRTTLCGLITNKDQCNVAYPTESIGDSGTVCTQTECIWIDNVRPEEKNCKQRDEGYSSSGQQIGKCDYSYIIPNNAECVDGRMQVEVTVDELQKGTCTCNPLPRSIPCGAVNVAALPFFGTLQLIVALIVIGVVYWLIVANRKKKR